MSNRRGFTLIETLIVIVVAGLMMAAGFPRLRQAMISTNLRSARNELAALHSQARAVAVERGRSSAIWINGNSAVVVVTPRAVALAGSTHDTVGGVHNFMTEFGATLAASGDPIGFDPRGVGTNAGTASLTLTKSSHTKTLTISPFGRLQP
jgi:prepilin-type N-terminal cleavage/methylation domain-containing protein